MALEKEERIEKNKLFSFSRMTDEVLKDTKSYVTFILPSFNKLLNVPLEQLKLRLIKLLQNKNEMILLFKVSL